MKTTTDKRLTLTNQVCDALIDIAANKRTSVKKYLEQLVTSHVLNHAITKKNK